MVVLFIKLINHNQIPKQTNCKCLTYYRKLSVEAEDLINSGKVDLGH